MTKIRAFGEPRLDAALDSILLASAPTEAPRPPVTRRFQKRAVGVAVLALCAGLGVAQWRAQSNGEDARKARFIAVAPYESLYATKDKAEAPEPVAVEESEATPPAPSRRVRTPTPSTTFYDNTPKPKPRATQRSASSQPDFTPERGAGPRGTVRFADTPDNSTMSLATMSGVVRSETARPKKRKAQPPKGPRHIRQLRQKD